MSVKSTWLLTTDLVSELECKSPSSSMPIYVNQSFWDDLISKDLIDWITDSNGIFKPMVSTHPVIFGYGIPNYTCTQDIINYYWDKHGCTVGIPAINTDCGCRLNGAHELYCEKWQPY